MIHFLNSLTRLLVGWANSQSGARRLREVPRHAGLSDTLAQLRAGATKLTGQPPTAEALAQSITALLG